MVSVLQLGGHAAFDFNGADSFLSAQFEHQVDLNTCRCPWSRVPMWCYLPDGALSMPRLSDGTVHFLPIDWRYASSRIQLAAQLAAVHGLITFL